ncbi:MAG: AI-2E family transporter [Syntrophomonadaceae bacterium]|nr:AI-2E family transporter [Syntrophomonadaceae bacterium]
MKTEFSHWHRYLLFIGVAIAASYFLYLLQEVMLTFAWGGILAYLLYHPVGFLQKQGLKRLYSILALYLIVLIALGFILYWGVPGLINEAGHLLEMYPQMEAKAEQIAEEIDGYNKPPQIDKMIDSNINKIESTVYNGLEKFIEGIYSFFNKIFILILSPILAFYILMDWEKIREWLLNLFSPSFRREVRALMVDMDRVLIEGLKGSVLIAAVVGTLVGLSALILGVKLPLVIGLLAGVTNLIPYFGALIGAIPAVVIAYSESWRLALYQTIAIVVIQQIESNIITPRILGGKLGLHPLFIIFALLAGGNLYGIWGILFAVPVAAMIKVTVAWLYLRYAS